MSETSRALNVDCVCFLSGGGCTHQAAPRRWLGPARCFIHDFAAAVARGHVTDPRVVAPLCGLQVRQPRAVPASLARAAE